MRATGRWSSFFGRCLALAAMAWCGQAGRLLAAERVEVEGVAFELPDVWGRLDQEGAAGTSAPGKSRIIGAWALEREGLRRATLVIETSPARAQVAEARLPGGKTELEQAARALPGMDSFQLRELKVVEVGGLQAFRIRGSLAAGEKALEQLQYVVGGRKTCIFTFTAPGGAFSEEEEGFGLIVHSASIERRAGFFEDVPLWMCGSFLGLIVGFSVAARRLLPAHGPW